MVWSVLGRVVKYYAIAGWMQANTSST